LRLVITNERLAEPLHRDLRNAHAVMISRRDEPQTGSNVTDGRHVSHASRCAVGQPIAVGSVAGSWLSR
jgi:hypothetical protein